ncbi:hypothetical protein [Shewanella sp. SG44-6]|nr:hypothetical protein [Shewanella sp. SG44-6]|tara:strand:- start:2911 stop:3036 length:126 start_codon:yes stop_codon:yes gene_type:complete
MDTREKGKINKGGSREFDKSAIKHSSLEKTMVLEGSEQSVI